MLSSSIVASCNWTPTISLIHWVAFRAKGKLTEEQRLVVICRDRMDAGAFGTNDLIGARKIFERSFPELRRQSCLRSR